MKLLTKLSYKDCLINLLKGDLDFKNENPNHFLHNFHPFPAKFPPQLPKIFIIGLTKEGDTVLDPMMGSGTTVLEAFINNRKGIGFDIDPLAVLISKIKTLSFDIEYVGRIGNKLLNDAKRDHVTEGIILVEEFKNKLSTNTRKFIDYWFAVETQKELIALINEVNEINDESLRDLFKIIFSGIIITKSGGVSLSLDLAHTRPHRAKKVLTEDGNLVFEDTRNITNPKREKLLSKVIKSPIVEFEKRLLQYLKYPNMVEITNNQPKVSFGNAQKLNLQDSTVDLIVTSPPYASNAIDYMRAHKFSLVWYGYEIEHISQQRSKYIGGDSTTNFKYENMTEYAENIIIKVSQIERKKGLILHRYYSEMKRVLTEMYRVLKPQKAAILVVGNSIMRNINTETAKCLCSLGKQIGFEILALGTREIDRNKRMLPVSKNADFNSQIQNRMHKEFVIGFYKS